MYLLLGISSSGCTSRAGSWKVEKPCIDNLELDEVSSPMSLVGASGVGIGGQLNTRTQRGPCTCISTGVCGIGNCVSTGGQVK